MSEFTQFAEELMDGSIEALKNNFGRVRTGRANPQVLNGITIDYYGVPTPITQVAAVSVPEAALIQISPWDAGTLNAIEHAIMESDLGITPSNDGKVIRLPFPKPTGERRQELVRECNQYAEEARISVRNGRRDAIDNVESMKEEMPEDMIYRETEAIQKVTDKYIAKVDEMLKAKEAEVMEI